MANNQSGVIKQTFEKLNQATGGVAGDVVGGLADTGKEMVKDVAKAPIDILKGLLGADGDEGVEESKVTSGSGSQQVGGSNNAISATKRMEVETKKQDKITQTRKMIAEYEQQWEKTKQEEEQKREQKNMVEVEEKKEIKQLKEEKQGEALVLAQAKQDRGSGEMMRKKN